MTTQLTLMVIGIVFLIVAYISNRKEKKKEQIRDKNFLPSLIFAVLGIVIVGIGVFGDSKAKSGAVSNKVESTKYSQSTVISDQSGSVGSDNTTVGRKLTANIYESNVNGLKTYLRFEGYDGSEGIGGSMTLSNNAVDCKYVFTYGVEGNNIEAEFIGSDCGAKSSNQTFKYDQSTNTLSCFINGQRFEFKAVFK